MIKNLRIIPKIDVKNFNLVKGIHLEGLRVLGDPKVFIKYYYDSGADEIIYHDVVASLYGKNQLKELVSRTANDIFLPLTVGGGISSIESIKAMLSSGADRVFANTAFIKNPKLINETVKYFGSSTIVASIETISKDGEYYCSMDFGREETQIKLDEWLMEVQDRGIGEIVITSIDQDGTGKGFDLKLAEKISKKIYIPYIINGGFGKLNHFDEVLNCCDPSGIAIGSILHYGLKNENLVLDQEEGNKDFILKNKKYLNFGEISIKKIKDHLKNKALIRET